MINTRVCSNRKLLIAFVRSSFDLKMNYSDIIYLTIDIFPSIDQRNGHSFIFSFHRLIKTRKVLTQKTVSNQLSRVTLLSINENREVKETKTIAQTKLIHIS